MKKVLAIIIVCITLMSLFVGCKKEEILPVVKINDGEVSVSVEEVYFYAFNLQTQYESDYGEDILFQSVSEGVTLGDSLKKEALETAIHVNLSAYMADQEGIVLDTETKEAMKKQAKDYFEAIDPALISDYNFTLELFQEVFLEYALRGKVMEYYALNTEIDEVQLEADMVLLEEKDPYLASIRALGIEEVAKKIRAKHILILTQNENGNPLDEAGKEAAYEKILEVEQRLEDGDAFEDLVALYSEDPGSVDKQGEYTFSRGQMVSEFENAALALEPGEISPIVETEYGYHIIMLEEKNILPTEAEIQAVKDYETNTINYAKEGQSQQAFEKVYEQWTIDNTIQINQGIWDAVVIKGQSGSGEIAE